MHSIELKYERMLLTVYDSIETLNGKQKQAHFDKDTWVEREVQIRFTSECKNREGKKIWQMGMKKNCAPKHTFLRI